MDAYDQFRQHISSRVDMPAALLDELASAFVIKEVRRRQFIIQPAFVSRYRNYVAQGAFRSYIIDREGVDHTIQFAIEDWWIGDYNSFTYQKPATMFVVALEDSVILQIDYEKERQVKAAHHLFETFFRVGAERTAAFHQRRIVSALTQTAEERYDEFIATYPNVVQRLPQYALASYLGMTTQFLSRIRRKKAK